MSYDTSLVCLNFDFQMDHILQNPLHWDLSWVTWIDPYGLVGLACMLEEISRRGYNVAIDLPQSDAVQKYIARMDIDAVFSKLDTTLDQPLPTIEGPEEPEYVLELRRFTNMSSGEDLANIIFDRLFGSTRTEIVEALFEAAVELAMNAAEHSQSPIGGYMSAFTHRRGQSDEFLVLAVGDLGIGIRRSLGRAVRVRDDFEAVEKAVERHISGTGSPGRGQGLPEVVSYIGRLGGWTVVRSGTARRQLGPHFPETRTVVRFPGTFVGAWLPCG